MRVNLEADVLARYVLQSLQALTGAATRPENGAESGPSGLTEDLLREQGFA